MTCYFFRIFEQFFRIRVFPAPTQNLMDRKFKAIFLCTQMLRYYTALCTPNPPATAPAFPALTVRLVHLYRSFPTETTPRCIIATPPALHSPNHQLHSARNKHALLHATPRILLLLRCCVTNPKSSRALGWGSAQCFLIFGFGLATC